MGCVSSNKKEEKRRRVNRCARGQEMRENFFLCSTLHKFSLSSRSFESKFFLLCKPSILSIYAFMCMTSFSNVILSKHYERDKTTEKEASKKKESLVREQQEVTVCVKLRKILTKKKKEERKGMKKRMVKTNK